MEQYKIKQAEKFNKLIDITKNENERIRQRQAEGKDLDKPILPKGTFTINSLAEQWYKCKMRDPFGRSRF